MRYQVLAILFLVACNEPASPTRRPSDGQGGTQGSIRLSAEAWNQIEDVNERYEDWRKAKPIYDRMRAINQGLCDRLQRVRQKCVVRRQLLNDSEAKALACDGKLTEIAPAQFSVEFKASPDAGAATFQLLANDLYETNAVASGANNITFTSKADDNKLSPSFSSIYKLDVAAPALPANTVVTMTLKVDGQAIINQQALQFNKGKASVDLRSVFDLSVSADCRVTDQEYLDLVKANPAPEPPPEKVPVDVKTLKAAPTDENLKSVSDNVSAELGKMIKGIEAEVSRNLALRTELTAASGAGCHLRKPIQTIDIEFTGQRLGPTKLGVRSASRSSKTERLSPTVQVDLGNIRFEIATDQNNPFGARHRVPRDVSETDIIAGITQLVIRKQGVAFDSPPTPCDRGGGLIGNAIEFIDSPTCYTIYERDRMVINGIKLWINDKLLFDDSKVNVKLDSTNLRWAYDRNIQNNPAWLNEIMQKTGCDETQ